MKKDAEVTACFLLVFMVAVVAVAETGDARRDMGGVLVLGRCRNGV